MARSAADGAGGGGGGFRRQRSGEAWCPAPVLPTMPGEVPVEVVSVPAVSSDAPMGMSQTMGLSPTLETRSSNRLATSETRSSHRFQSLTAMPSVRSVAFDSLLDQLREQWLQRSGELGELRREVSRLQAELAQRSAATGAADGAVDDEPQRCILSAPAAAGSGGGHAVVGAGGAWAAPPDRGAARLAVRSLDTTESSVGVRSAQIGVRSARSMALKSMTRKASLSFLDDESFRQKGTNFVNGPLEWIVSIVILSNVAFVFAQLELVGRQRAQGSVELTQDSLVFVILSNLFTVLFLMELVAKVIFLRSSYFFADQKVQKFNLFDVFLVLLSMLDAWILSPMAQKSNIGVARALRVVRVLRVLRVARALKIFTSLRVLVSAVVSSFLALFWSMVLLGIVILAGGLFLCQALASYLEDPSSMDTRTKEWAENFYGTSSKAVWSLFEATFSGGWPNYARPLIDDVHPIFALFWAVYVSAVIFAMTRIITALFLKETLAAASQDVETTVHEQLKQKRMYAEKLRDFFDVADTSRDGYLSWEEFRNALEDERIRVWMGTLELSVTESRRLFDMLDDGDGQVSINEFIEGSMNLKGQARSQDVLSIMRDCSRLLRKVEVVNRSVQKLAASAQLAP